MSDPAATTPTSASSNGSGSERVSVAAFVNRGRLDAALCGLRLCGLLCMLAFYLMGPAFYYLGLRAMLAAYVLRLYQRVGVRYTQHSTRSSTLPYPLFKFLTFSKKLSL